MIEAIEAFQEELIVFDDFILELTNQTIDAIDRARAGVEVDERILSYFRRMLTLSMCSSVGGATTNEECAFEKAEAIRLAIGRWTIAMLAAELVREGVVFDSQAELDEEMTLYERLDQLEFILIQGLDGENYRKFGNQARRARRCWLTMSSDSHPLRIGVMVDNTVRWSLGLRQNAI